MHIMKHLLPIFVLGLVVGCYMKTPDQARVPLLEVEGRFLYLDQVEEIIPPNIGEIDSVQIADSYIRKWVTDVLLYENAKRNVTNKAEIEKLLDDYRKSLIIHQYQQNILQQRFPEAPSEEEVLTFYQNFGNRFVLGENLLKGILLVLPEGAPKLNEVRKWVQSGGDTEALQEIEKYTLQHGLSYDYFADRWISLNEILKKIPIPYQKITPSLAAGKYYEVSDSLKIYMLNVDSIKRIGEIEPFETAKEKITNIILNRLKFDFIMNFEDELYRDAVKNGKVTFFNKTTGSK